MDFWQRRWDHVAADAIATTALVLGALRITGLARRWARRKLKGR
jgi:hypothetical protein